MTSARVLILDAHAAVNRSLNARTRRLQLKHGHRALELLNEAFKAAPSIATAIPESTAHPDIEVPA